jgi:CSLREA domain-containing protein
MGPSARSLLRAAVLALAATSLALLLLWLPQQHAVAGPVPSLTFTVTSTADVPDAQPGDGVCETATNNGVCTLRAAIQETNARQGHDTIVLPAGVYQLTRVGQDDTALNGDLDISSTLTILGAGPGSTVIDGNGGVTGDRVFDILTGTVVISGVTIQHGQVPLASNFGGGGIEQLGGALTLENSEVLSNTAPDGGGIENLGGVLTIEHSVIRGNTGGTGLGGGVESSGPLLVRDSTISGNSAAAGAGIDLEVTTRFHNVQMTVLNSTISGNTAQSFGGGIRTDVNLDVVNSTIAGNASTGDAGGLGLAPHNQTMRLFNATVVDNLANANDTSGGIGGGIFVCATVTCTNPPTVTFQNSIVAGNESLSLGVHGFTIVADDCAGRAFSLSHNILSAVDPSHCAVAGTFVLTEPQLSPLADNGGPTLTQLPQAGSPAIDGGTPGGCTDPLGAILPTDQRGAARTVGAACDVGATEAGAKPSLTVLSPMTAVVGGPAFSLRVDGVGFIEETEALWAGAPRATTVLSSTRLSVTIPAGDLTAAAEVTVAARYTTLTDTLSNALPFTVTKLDQTISFGPLPDRTFGDPPFPVSATASSGLPVSFSASGACSVAGTQVTVTGVGSCTITANQPGDSEHNAAPSAVQTFTVTRGSQAITFGPLPARTVGGPPFQITASASSGLPVSFSASGQCTVSGNMVTLSGVGSCTITASQAGDGTHNAAPPVSQTFTIGPINVYVPGALNGRGIG